MRAVPHPFRSSALTALALLGVAACRSPLPPELDAPPPAVVHDAQEPQFVRPGEPAPVFELVDLEGITWRLEDLAGRRVVLLWFDPECPFLVHAYRDRGLSELSARLIAQGVTWLGINSSGPGRVGWSREANVRFVTEHDILHPVLRDEDGAVARRFGARRAPEAFVIAPDGTLAYRGPLDNAPFGVVPGGGERRSYVELALEAVASGRAPSVPMIDPYGCRLRLATVAR
jgi:peroxiredoxin